MPPGFPNVPAVAPGDSVEKKMEEKMASQAQLQERLEAEALEAIKSPHPASKKKEVLTRYLRESLKKDPVCQVQNTPDVAE